MYVYARVVTHVLACRSFVINILVSFENSEFLLGPGVSSQFYEDILKIKLLLLMNSFEKYLVKIFEPSC